MDKEFIQQYIGKIAKISLTNGYYYKGKVTDVNSEILSLVDIKGKNVTLMISSIMLIEEAGGVK